ncbi:hypothetical protein ASG90_07845 [Nocardioides sp. Soil797]|nr:hypothetical protein ASG90_07845 [Nocardioides sp. Soil797]
MIELWIPGIRRFPPGQVAVAFEVSDDHTGFDVYDLSTQQGASHHDVREPDGTFRHGTSNFGYIWPGECDLMAQLAGLEPEPVHQRQREPCPCGASRSDRVDRRRKRVRTTAGNT